MLLENLINKVKEWKDKQDKEREERLAKLKRRVKILRHLTYRQLQNTAKRYGQPTHKEETEFKQAKDGTPAFKTRVVPLKYDELIYLLSRNLCPEHFEEIKRKYNIKVKEGEKNERK